MWERKRSNVREKRCVVIVKVVIVVAVAVLNDVLASAGTVGLSK